MHAYAYPTPLLTGRAAFVSAVALMHVLLAWALMTGLGRTVVELAAKPFDLLPAAPSEKPIEPPPVPDPTIRPIRVDRVDPMVRGDAFAQEDTGAVTLARGSEPLSPPDATPSHAVRVAPQLDMRRSPSTEGFYPPVSRRNEEEGAVTVSACIDAQGDVHAPRIDRGSGFPRLDDAALRWAQRARFAPGSEGGRAIEVCDYRFRVVFRLER